MTKNIPCFSNFSGNQDTVLYNIVGNFIPPEWKDLTGNCGQQLSKTAKQLLSLIVSRLQLNTYVDKYVDKQTIDELREGYHFFQQELGVCQRRVRQCLLELQTNGFIDLYTATIIKYNIKCRNILCIKLVKNFINFRKLDSNSKGQNFQVYPKEISGKPERNFASSRKNFQPLNIIDNNISTSISRYGESNFFKNDLEEISSLEIDRKNEQAKAEFSQTPAVEAITMPPKGSASKPVVTNSTSHSDQDDLDQDHSGFSNLEQEDVGNKSGWVSKIANKARSWHFGRKLEEFHPLSEEDAATLRIRSNRDFNLHFINKLLLRLNEQSPGNRFYSKKAVLSYMSSALIHEMRQTTMVNNENFNFKRDDATKTREQYLQKVEACFGVQEINQLKKKVASVFEPDKAYDLLTSCRFLGLYGESYRIGLARDIALLDSDKEILLNQVQAVYGNQVQGLEIVPLRSAKQAVMTSQAMIPDQAVATNQDMATNDLSAYCSDSVDKTTTLPSYGGLSKLNPQSVWYKVRQYLLEYYGEAVDKSWFSQLEAIEEDVTCKKVTLKPTTAFIGYWIKQNYDIALDKAFRSQNFTFELMKVDQRVAV